MLKTLYFFTSLCLILSCTKASESRFPKPPSIAGHTVIDTIWGKTISDPYRNLENLKDSTVANYLKSQNEYTDEVLTKHPKFNEFLGLIEKKKDENDWSISKIRVTDSGKYFYVKKHDKEDFSKLYFRNEIDGQEILLFDPVESSEKNKTINYIQPSWDESKIVIGLTEDDKEFCDLKILDVKSKILLPNFAKNALPNSFGGIEWLPDNSGFIYTYTPVIDSKEKGYLFNSRAVVFNLKKGESIDLFSKEGNPEIGFNKEDFPLIYYTSTANKYMLGQNAGVDMYRDTYYAKIEAIDNKKINWKPLYKKSEQIKQFSLQDDVLYYRTSKDAPNFKLCKTSLSNPDFKNPEVIVEEYSDVVITDFTVTKKGLFYTTSKNGVEANLYWVKNGKSERVILPFPSGYLNVFSKGIHENSLWIKAEGWLNDLARYKFNFDTEEFEEESISNPKNSNILEDIVVEEIEIPSHDGVMVPLSLVYKKGLELNGKNSLLIVGYGGYGYSYTPYLNSYLENWVNQGGIYAMAHVRGGGEKGDAWHKAGKKLTKPNTWKDFIACTEFLIEKKYTNAKQIVGTGTSAGGITIGRAITEKPELFAAAIIRVGMLNPLRLHESPNGLNNAKEFGSIKDSLEFIGLKEMDAYYHIKDNVDYPAVLLTTGFNDARVAPWESAKFATRMQEATASDKPILLAVNFEGGHGFEANQKLKNEELAKVMIFSLWQTGHPDYQIE